MDRIDLAHGSFFALHRPLLGFTNMSMEVAAQQGHAGKFSNESELCSLFIFLFRKSDLISSFLLYEGFFFFSLDEGTQNYLSN
jgi:hypothetical protein